MMATVRGGKGRASAVNERLSLFVYELTNDVVERVVSAVKRGEGKEGMGPGREL